MAIKLPHFNVYSRFATINKYIKMCKFHRLFKRNFFSPKCPHTTFFILLTCT